MTVDAWEDTGFHVDEIEAWLAAGCFDAARAAELDFAGLDAGQCGGRASFGAATRGETIAAAYCYGILDLEGVRGAVEVAA